ncbi:MAG: hypothetical protein ABSB15_08325 [Bryobacteraceae bacterium]
MKEVRERLTRFENEFLLYAGCALSHTRKVDAALAHTLQKLRDVRSEAVIPGNERGTLNALEECMAAFRKARLAWGA